MSRGFVDKQRREGLLATKRRGKRKKRGGKEKSQLPIGRKDFSIKGVERRVEEDEEKKD